MTRLAVAEHPRFEVSDVELRRSGPSYTVDTLEALRPRGDLHLIIGSETFLDLLSWHEPRRLPGLARLVVVPRSGNAFDPHGAGGPEGSHRARARTVHGTGGETGARC